MSSTSSSLHCGFEPGTPGTATWSRSAFVQSLSPAEVCDLRGWYVMLMVLGLVFVGGGFAGLCWILFVPGYEHLLDQITIPSAVSVGALVIGMADLVLLGHGLKRLMIRRVSHRTNRLFDPTLSPTFFVEIHRFQQGRKIQWMLDDLALITSRNGLLDLEMIAHRARFPLHELRIVEHPHPAMAAVEVTYPTEYPNWSVIISPLTRSWNPIELMSTKAERKDLAQWIHAGKALVCRRCGYDLRARTGPQCPECGEARYHPRHTTQPKPAGRDETRQDKQNSASLPGLVDRTPGDTS